MLGFEIFVRIVALIFLGMNFLFYRAAIRYFEEADLKPERKRQIVRSLTVLAVVFNLVWLVILVFGLKYKLRATDGTWTAFYVYGLVLYQVTVFVTNIALLISAILKHISRLTKRFLGFAAKLVTPGETELFQKPLNPSRRGFLKKTAPLLPAAVFAAATYGMFKSEYDHIVNEVEVKIANLPDRLKGYSITQLSDFHIGPFIGEEKLKLYVQVANGLKSDMIVVTGDVVNDSADVFSYALPLLSQLKARDGIYFCMGNHDYIADRSGRRVANGMKNIGFNVLLNEGRQLTLNEEQLYLGAVEYIGSRDTKTRAAWLEEAMREKKDESIPTVLLAHHPIIFEEVKASPRDIDLTLSGHTHGGQIVLAELGDIKISPMFGHKYLKGRYQSGDSTLYVNSGLGHWLPIRINCPPEFTRFTLL